jgi:hypothetical protein
VEDNGFARSCSRALGSTGRCSVRTRSASHRRLLWCERRQPPLGIRRGAAVQVQRHRQHAHLLRGPPGPRRPAGFRHRPGPRRRRRRQGPGTRGRPLERGVLGQGQRPGLPPGRQHQVRRCRERAHRHRRGVERPPGHAERARRPRVRGPRRQHQGVHGGEDGHGREFLAAVRRRVQGRRRDVAHRAVPGEQRRAAAGQRVPLLRVQIRPGHRPQLRAVPAELDHGDRPGERAVLHQPLRRDGGRRPRRGGQGGRRRRRRRRGVGERVAVGGREGRQRGQRADVQPEPGRPRGQGHAQEARGDGGVRIRHVQRGPEAGGPHRKEVWVVQS